MITSCAHEGYVLTNSIIYENDTERFLFISCVECNATGARLERYNDPDADYTHKEETWHTPVAEANPIDYFYSYQSPGIATFNQEEEI